MFARARTTFYSDYQFYHTRPALHAACRSAPIYMRDELSDQYMTVADPETGNRGAKG